MRLTPVAVAWVTAGLLACTSTAPTASSASVAKTAARASFRYLAIGDSFTIGTGSGEDHSFPSVFAQTSACRVDMRNVARNGFTTLDVIARELPSLATFHPDFVTLAIGANDIVQGRTPDEYRASVKDILQAILDAGVKPERIVLLPQPRWDRTPAGARFGPVERTQESIAKLNAILKEEGARVGARWLPIEELLDAQAAEKAFAPDGLHPSAEAHAAWAKALDELVCNDSAR
ncbi:MAG: SGNH/GDSL hydrolase family protein [Polyangiaceae bacterium]